jgi:hypothetical protein
MIFFQKSRFMPPGASGRQVIAENNEFLKNNIHFLFNPFSGELVLQITLLQITLFSLAPTWVHSYAITSWTKQALNTNVQL